MLDRTSFLRAMVPEAGVAARRHDPASGFLFQIAQAEAEEAVQSGPPNQAAARKPAAANTVAGMGAPAVTEPATAAPAFASWFQTVNMCAAGALTDANAGAYTIRRANCASEKGAAEALRLVQRFAPGARIEAEQYVGPWAPDRPIYVIVLPNGEKMNAGLILDHYYQHGAGAHGLSGSELESQIRVLSGETARFE